MSSNPSILFVSPFWPSEQTYGGQLRAFHTAAALARLGRLRMVVVANDAPPPAVARRSSEAFDLEPAIVARPLAPRSLVQSLRWLVDRRYLELYGYVIDEADRRRIRSYLREYDMLWIMQPRTANLCGLWRWPNAHLDIDDVPSEYFRTLSRWEKNAAGRLKARLKRRALARRERRFPDRFATLSVCSLPDRRLFGNRPNVHVVPNGHARPAAEPTPRPQRDPIRIGFIGLYEYPPNHHGVAWFLRECWPAIRRAVPGIRFRLVGAGSDGQRRPTEPDVDALGWVADPAAEMATWSATVVPIHFGAGTRLKLAGGLASKCPMISTSFGAYGYAVADGVHLRIADRAAEFASACVQVVRDPSAAAAMAERGWKAYLDSWTWDAITPKILAAAEDCLRRAPARRHDAERRRPGAPTASSVL